MNKAIVLAALLVSSSTMAATSFTNEVSNQSDDTFLNTVSSQEISSTQITNATTQLDEKKDLSFSQQRPTPELRGDTDGFASLEIEFSSLSE
ncbi:hypothetical protein [Vibrio ulleungensis]|uniref:Uncharacterized protein n=1 Tax=Vibrio ulleungensis TaxID=2807619 RepID=A0ABS2HKV1_9VIBR|nr:hypothetical protein [Vibrio ulleungensis]MBM7038098.1 hypothetical protein [Vibrio ulleungensis]